jgi:anti-anti-sigma regulatory factor
MTILLEKSGGKSVIRLAGAVTIASAAELKTALLEAVASNVDILISLEEVTEVDVSILQLIVASARDANLSGQELTSAAPTPPVVSQAVQSAGLAPFWISAAAEAAAQVVLIGGV